MWNHRLLEKSVSPFAVVTGILLLASGVHVFANDEDEDDHDRSNSFYVSSGQRITPTAAPRSVLQYLNPHLALVPNFVASGGISSVVSPDGKTLLVLTSGHNDVNDATGKTAITFQYIFVYDITNGVPVERQVLTLPNSCAGIVFNPDGHIFYVTGGVEDTIRSFALQKGGLWTETGSPIVLGHKTGALFLDSPVAAGIAISQDGSKLVVANLYNDSVTLVDVSSRSVVKELDLRPGKINPAQAGVPGGEYPYWVVFKGNDLVYVSSLRDREIVVVQVGPSTASVKSRIPLEGNPTKMILNRSQRTLFVAEDNSDRVSFVDTESDRVSGSVRTVGPEWILWNIAQYHGITPNSLCLSPDEHTLYVTNGGNNSVAAINLWGCAPHVVGLYPTGFYPNSVCVNPTCRYLYVVNGKSPTGPNPTYYPKSSPTRNAGNQYVEELEKSSLLSFPLPDFWSNEELTRTVLGNNSYIPRPHLRDAVKMRELRRRIKHVIYIIRENRTYDQLLGDLDRGNGDPNLAEFGQKITPNAHLLADQFVDADNFFVSGDVSANGWAWTTGARESDFETKAVPLNYSGRGTDYETEGTNRNLNVSVATLAERRILDPLVPNDPDLLPGTANVVAPDGPGAKQKERGYIWDAVVRAGLTVRNYGVFLDDALYFFPPPLGIPLERYPFQNGVKMATPANQTLKDRTDLYYRGFDTAYPDFYRELEWEREFNEFDKNGELPNFEMVRLGRNHTGSYGTSLDGTNTPEIQQAENDYAVARLIERLSKSRYKDDTVVIVLEDDAQDGADHVDSHRSTFFVAGAYVKHGAVISNRYTTVNVVRTIEDLLGTDHVNVNTATQRPMANLFDLRNKEWTFRAIPSAYLANTQLPIDKSLFTSYQSTPKPLHDGAYWSERTRGLDFSREDKISDPASYNRLIWAGVQGDGVPYPEKRTGTDLRKNRLQLLKRIGIAKN